MNTTTARRSAAHLSAVDLSAVDTTPRPDRPEMTWVVQPAADGCTILVARWTVPSDEPASLAAAA